MNNLSYLFSPLEQFEILPVYTLNFGPFDLSITNQTIILILIFSALVFFSYSSLHQSSLSLYIVPHRWQSVLEIMFSMILSMVVDNIHGKKTNYFFLLFFLYFFL